MKKAPSGLSPTAASSKKKLSTGQRKFNGLIKKIEKQREVLQSWETAMPLYLQRWHEEFVPLLKAWHHCSLTLVYLLDELSERIKLGKSDRHALAQEICERSYSLIGNGDCTEEDRAGLKALYNKHSGHDFDEDQNEDDELFKQGLQEIYGFDLGDDIDVSSPEALAKKLHERLLTEHEAEQPDAAKKTASEGRREADAARASQSVREIYRKLASALHPDRETDPAERERKTLLMQRVNHAYGERNLLDLLQLQLEIEHISAESLETLPADRLKHYNEVLSEQLAGLEAQVFGMELEFKEQFQLDPFEDLTPKNLAGTYQYQIENLRDDVQQLVDLHEFLEHPKLLKAWLREQRERQRALDDMAFEADLFDDLPDDLFR